MYYNLSFSNQKLKTPPQYIVVMSGNGIPSESGLMRTYFASEIAKKHPSTKIIITMPGDTTDTASACYLMKKEFGKVIMPAKVIYSRYPKIGLLVKKI